MKFAVPLAFHLLWIVAGFAVFLWWANKRKEKIMRRFIEKQLIEDVAASFSRNRQTLKNILMVIVFFFSIMALARPQWGFQWQEVKRHGLDILVAIDTSKSMLTEDVRPNRLERTKLAVKDLVKLLKGDRIGLIAFSGDAFMVCPLTVDYGGFLLALGDVDTQTIPRGGTSIASALKEAIKGYDETQAKYKAVIIITDGENLEGDPIAAAKEAKEKGIKVFCIGIGTKEGEVIRVQNEQGSFEFLKDSQGNFIKSRLNENLLQEIALTTGGVYVRASGAEFGLELVYNEQLSKMEKRDIESKMEKRFHERFQFPLGIAIFILAMETWLSSRRKI